MESINYCQTLKPSDLTATSGSFTTTDGTGGTITTISNNAGALNSGLLYNPYYYSYPYYYGTAPTPLLTVDKAENGFIIKKDSKTFICKTAEEIVKYLK
jgi:hypothetical protein